jgi:NAD(P)-dependent dehydrogenase (short-subunit alcohol dehydrogenase family)
MMKILEGKTTIITGGSGGLGISVVKLFLEHGANVICTYHREDELKKLMPLMEQYQKSVVLVKGNVTKEKPILKIANNVVSRFKSVDILINIVGGFRAGDITNTGIDTFDQMIDLNLKSTFICCKSVIPQMIKQKSGKIINLAAKPALSGAAGISAYAASKAGVLNLTKSLSEEVLKYNINVNAIVPGTIDTEANRRAMPKAKHKNWVKPEQIAKVMLFLCSKDSDPISGTGIPVYGKSYLN